MLNDILTASGLPYKAARFPDPPATTYIIYFDDVVSMGPDPIQGGADGVPYILAHNVTFELYAPTIDRDAETALEAAIAAQGLEYTAQGWCWLRELQRYQQIVEISYTEKGELIHGKT